MKESASGLYRMLKVMALTLLKFVTSRFTVTLAPGKAVLFSSEAVCPKVMDEIKNVSVKNRNNFLNAGVGTNGV
jgi:hypothetical protein